MTAAATTDDAGTDEAIALAAGAWSKGGHLNPPADYTTNTSRNLWRMIEGATRWTQAMLDRFATDRDPMKRQPTSEELVTVCARALVIYADRGGYRSDDAEEAVEFAQQVVDEAVRRLERDGGTGEPNGCDREDPSAADIETPFPIFTAKQVRTMPPVPFRVAALSLPERGLAAFAGPSGHGKGLVTMDLTHTLARGTLFRGDMPVEQCAVAIIVAEGWSGIPGRQRAVETRHQIPDDEDVFVYYIPAAMPLDDLAVAEQVGRTLRSRDPRPRVLLVDTYRATNSGDENDSTDAARYIRSLQHLAEAIDGLVVAIVHAPWNAERERGSTAFRAAMDWVALIQKEDDVVTMTCLKAKDGPEFKPLRWRIEAWADSATVVPIGDKDEREAPVRWDEIPLNGQKLLTTLARDFDDTGATAANLRKASRVPESSYFRTIKELNGWGFVMKHKTRLLLTATGRGVLP